MKMIIEQKISKRQHQRGTHSIPQIDRAILLIFLQVNSRFKNKIYKNSSKILCMPDARFVFIRLISEARIETEEDRVKEN